MITSASLVKLVPANIRKLYINLKDVNGGLGTVTQSGFGVALPFRAELVDTIRKIRPGTPKSTEVSDPLVLNAGDIAVVRLGTIRPSKYQVSLAVNPALVCDTQAIVRVTAPTIIEPKQELVLKVLIEVVSGVVSLHEYQNDLATLYVHA